MIFRHLLNMRSHPTWVRELKPYAAAQPQQFGGRTLRGCVNWNLLIFLLRKIGFCRTLRGCVD